MNNTIKCVLCFATGLIAGITVSKKFYFESKLEEETDSIKREFARHYNKDIKVAEEQETAILNKPVNTTKTDYTAFSKDKQEPKKEHSVAEPNTNPEKYIIPPELFADDPDYNVYSLSLYADDILTCDGHVMDDEDISEALPEDYKSHFGEYEDDSVFVQHDGRKCYYEVLLKAENYN